MSRTCVFKWPKRFKKGREEVEDDSKSGRPSTSRNDDNIELVRQKVRSDCQLTVRKKANQLGISCKKVWIMITKELRIKKICSKMFPK